MPIPAGSVSYKRAWRGGLCECFGDCSPTDFGTCCLVTWVPFVAFGRARRRRVDHGAYSLRPAVATVRAADGGRRGPQAKHAQGVRPELHRADAARARVPVRRAVLRRRVQRGADAAPAAGRHAVAAAGPACNRPRLVALSGRARGRPTAWRPDGRPAAAPPCPRAAPHGCRPSRPPLYTWWSLSCDVRMRVLCDGAARPRPQINCGAPPMAPGPLSGNGSSEADSSDVPAVKSYEACMAKARARARQPPPSRWPRALRSPHLRRRPPPHVTTPSPRRMPLPGAAWRRLAPPGARLGRAPAARRRRRGRRAPRAG